LACPGARSPATRVATAIAAGAVAGVTAIDAIGPVGAALASAAPSDARLVLLYARVVPVTSAGVIRAATTRGPGGGAQTQDQQ
jgi:hypothetical protein